MTQLLKPYLRVFFCLGLKSGCSLSYRVWKVAQFTINERKFKSSHECKQEDSFLTIVENIWRFHMKILLSHKGYLCW